MKSGRHCNRHHAYRHYCGSEKFVYKRKLRESERTFLGWTSENIREADVSSLEISDHGAHLVPLPRPVVALERRATIRIHQHTPYSLISTGVLPRKWYTASAIE
jgi:hypothetical protein